MLYLLHDPEQKVPENLISKGSYQVFLMSCRCGLPISFANHHWFVVNRNGVLSRWEILWQKDCCGKSWGHLHLNAKDPFKPIGLFSVQGTSFWEPTLLGRIEGGSGSVAEKMATFIENSPSVYPYCNKYFLSGPNSNTYVRWVLDQFPEFEASLPWNAFGRGHEVKV